MSDDNDDIQDPIYHIITVGHSFTCTWVCRGLDGSTCSEPLPERTCHFEPPEHVPRTSARAQTCVRSPGGLPACHGAESARKDPRPEEKKMPKGQKTHLYMYNISRRRRVSSDKKAIKKLSYVQVQIRPNLTADEKMYTI